MGNLTTRECVHTHDATLQLYEEEKSKTNQPSVGRKHKDETQQHALKKTLHASLLHHAGN
jgi:hypothetical protein